MSTIATPKERVLAAALGEFAEHGVAGARVDRIARAAKTSKERVYAYFRSKEELYAAVAADQLQQVMDSTVLDPADLPGYVGELFDFYVQHPDMLRLVAWSRLEPNERLVGLGDAGVASLRTKLDAIEQGQRDGVLDDAFEPIDVLMFLIHLSMGWLSAIEFHTLEDATDPAVLARRRAAAVLAAERLFPST
ncbi:TetR family transcriptional regulator [Solirubrobacter phytolaccae]|uniref:TetR family transcriptional regulator n=1 Tax=Solirubrobacter phytolaccae TaxID=1404360 RepID=A0A9X3SIT9_9ACTN|nr:TetR family transcriptional regulator [Solirubrobacter phytolaccae]MDA0184517.1 TetR family transcriptional regulator [Solirubrobacter phytolaccae]